MVEYNNLAIVAITLTLTVLISTEIFALKEVREKKKGMMFNWVHDKLAGGIYIPLSTWALSFSKVLQWDDSIKIYRENIFLYRLSKLLHYWQKNRKIVGDSVFFTMSNSSNYYLSYLLDLIINEINYIFDYSKKDTSLNEKIEQRLISIEYLLKLGECQSYSDFILFFKNQQNNNLNITMDEINQQNIHLKNSVRLLFDEEIEHKWRRMKLYAYCCLFNHLMTQELFKIYDSWYEERKNISSRKRTCKYIKKILKLIKQSEKYHTRCAQLIHDASDNNTNVSDYSMKLDAFKKILVKIDAKINEVEEKDELIAHKKFLEYKVNEIKLLEKIQIIYKNINKIQKIF